MRVTSSPTSGALLVVDTFLRSSGSVTSPFYRCRKLVAVVLLAIGSSRSGKYERRLKRFLGIAPSGGAFLLFAVLDGAKHGRKQVSTRSSSMLVPSNALGSLRTVTPFDRPTIKCRVSYFSSEAPPRLADFFRYRTIDFSFFAKHRRSPLPSGIP